MNATTRKPRFEVPGDKDHQMARDGVLMGLSPTHAIWRFGQLSGSESAKRYGVHTGEGFYWVLTALGSAEVLDVFHGPGRDMPPRFREVMDAPLGAYPGRGVVRAMAERRKAAIPRLRRYIRAYPRVSGRELFWFIKALVPIYWRRGARGRPRRAA